MISEIKAAIINKLTELYPTGYTIYDEELPEAPNKPSFLITLTGQSYGKRLGNKFISELSFDITFYSDQTAVRTDCIKLQEEILRAFDFIGTYQIRNKSAKITDNVLHFTFDIRYSEIQEEQSSIMQKQLIKTNL